MMFAILKHAIPEFITALLMGFIGIKLSEPMLIGSLFLMSTFLLRLIWTGSSLIHGLGHVCFIAICDRDPCFFNAVNILEHQSLASLLKSLLPFGSIHLPFTHDTAYPWVAVGKATPWSIRVKASGGILFNAIALGLVPFTVSLNLTDLLALPDLWLKSYERLQNAARSTAETQ